MLNDQTSNWLPHKAGVPEGSIYINDLPDNIVSSVNLFADDTSLFSTLYKNNAPRDALNGDLDKMAKWAFNWKIQFKPDMNKQA